MEGQAEEAERRLAWEAQVDEAVAVVSVAGEEAAALLARREEESSGDGGETGNEEGGGEGSFESIDVGDEDQVSALREAGFDKAGPLQLRLLVEVEIGEGESEGGGGGRIELTVGGAAASVSSLQPLRLAAALPRRYLMPHSLASSSSPEAAAAAEGDEEDEERAPSVSLSAPWLSTAAAARLEKRLRSLARELLEQQQEEPLPVVFDLVELAKGAALAEALSAPSSAAADGSGRRRSLDLLEVVRGGGEGGNDAEAEEAAALALLRRLLADDAAQRRRRFLRGTHSCPICLDDGVPGSRATALPCCGARGRRSSTTTATLAMTSGGRKEKENPEEDEERAACSACLSALASSALLSKDASALLCPFPDCREPLPPGLLSSFLTREQAELAEQLRLERALAQMGALRCPHCDFSAVVSDTQGCCLCPNCRHSFCAQCFDSWHGSARECSSPEARLALARARRARAERESGSGGSGSGGANDKASALALRRAEEEFLSLAAIARGGSKSCPACRTNIERSSGCNRMRCAACSTSFCFVCSAVILEEEGYSHFGSGKCRLLSAEEIARWEREERGPDAAAADRNAFWLGLARRQQQQEQQRGGNGGDGGMMGGIKKKIKVSRCPTCGAQHAGESNDRRCGACKTRHCGSCGEVLRRGVVHFGRPPKCPAHF